MQFAQIDGQSFLTIVAGTDVFPVGRDSNSSSPVPTRDSAGAGGDHGADHHLPFHADLFS